MMKTATATLNGDKAEMAERVELAPHERGREQIARDRVLAAVVLEHGGMPVVVGEGDGGRPEAALIAKYGQSVSL